MIKHVSEAHVQPDIDFSQMELPVSLAKIINSLILATTLCAYGKYAQLIRSSNVMLPVKNVRAATILIATHRRFVCM